MPKVTMVTIPDEVFKIPKLDSKKESLQFKTLKLFLHKVYLVLLSLVYRDNLMLNLLAFLLGRVSIIGEMSPVGLAFFAAVAKVGRTRSLAVAIWTTIGVLSSGYYIEASIYAFAITLYYVWLDKLTRLHKKLFTIPLMMFCTVLCGGLIIRLSTNFTLYNGMLTLFDAGVCMVLTGIFVYGIPVILGSKGAREIEGNNENIVCVIVILSMAIAGISNITLFEYSLRNILGSLLIMSMALIGGSGMGATVGIGVGLVIGLSDGNAPIIVSLYALAGLLSGIFRDWGKFAVIIGFLLGSALTLLYFGQDNVLLAVLTECAFGAVVFILVPTRYLSAFKNNFYDLESKLSSNTYHLSEAAAKINNIAEMFSELAGNFSHVTANTKDKLRDDALAGVLSAVGEQVCKNCTKRTQCWEDDFYRTYQAVLEMLGQAESDTLTTGGMPVGLRDNCVRRKELVGIVKAVAEHNRALSFWQRKIADNRQMITEQMRSTSVIIGNLAQEITKEQRSDRELSMVLKQKAALLECPLSSVRITGQQGSGMVEICKQACNGKRRECMNTLLPLAASVMKEKLTLHAECGNEVKNKKCKLVMHVAKRFNVETGMASAAKEQGVSGDTCAVVHLNKGKLALILSDGMGSGKEAAIESATAVQFLKRMLGVGFDVDVAVKTVNSMLLLKSPDETFATIDMAIVDTYSGEVEFLKIGSAPSFIKRVREVSTIKCSSLPIGILEQIEFEPLKSVLVAGDIVVMVSDGIIDIGQKNNEKEYWLANFLRRSKSNNPQELAQQILTEAKALSGKTMQDDMSVLVAKITERINLV